MSKIDEYRARYQRAAHAMQTGVALTMEEPIAGQSQETDPKHLRVGVNSAMVEFSALVKLLVAKGVISEDEFFRSLAEGMEAEAESYRARLSKRFGREIQLG